MPSHVLFVEDDPLLLQMYRSMAPELPGFELHLASSGREGLEHLLEHSFDAVVTDLTMEGMDGSEFLGHVIKRQPDCARIIISGYADRLKVAELLSVGHRYLSKPFEPGALIQLLKRVARFRALLLNDKVKTLIGSVGALPSPPEIYIRLSQLLNSPYSSLEEVGGLVEQDPGLTAKLLQIVNSAQFGLSRKIMSAAEAVQMLGVAIVRDISLGLQAFSISQKNPSKPAAPPELWQHSINTAMRARRIAQAERRPKETVEATFLTGLLHDIGKLVISTNARADYTAAKDLAAAFQIPVTEAETRLFGADHALLGGYLIGLWGLPESVVRAIECHHALHHFPEEEDAWPLACTLAAQHIERLERGEPSDTSFIEHFSIEEKIPAWREELGTRSESP